MKIIEFINDIYLLKTPSKGALHFGQTGRFLHFSQNISPSGHWYILHGGLNIYLMNKMIFFNVKCNVPANITATTAF